MVAGRGLRRRRRAAILARVESTRALRLADAVLRVGRAVVRRVPPRLRRALDDRLFFAIFQVTRVENDAYGWRPERPAEEDPPDAGSASRERG